VPTTLLDGDGGEGGVGLTHFSNRFNLAEMMPASIEEKAQERFARLEAAMKQDVTIKMYMRPIEYFDPGTRDHFGPEVERSQKWIDTARELYDALPVKRVPFTHWLRFEDCYEKGDAVAHWGRHRFRNEVDAVLCTEWSKNCYEGAHRQPLGSKAELNAYVYTLNTNIRGLQRIKSCPTRVVLSAIQYLCDYQRCGNYKIIKHFCAWLAATHETMKFAMLERLVAEL
jgi:hypothetical protein